MPDETKRKLWARRLIVGATLLVMLVAWQKPESEARPGTLPKHSTRP